MYAKLGVYTCEPLVENKVEVYSLLADNVYSKDKQLTDLDIRKLKKLIKVADVLVVRDGDTIVGTCVFRFVYNYIDLIHMYVLEDYRYTDAARILIYYLLKVYALGKKVLITTFDARTFKSAIEPYGTGYIIKPKVLAVAEKLIGNKVIWSS